MAVQVESEDQEGYVSKYGKFVTLPRIPRIRRVPVIDYDEESAEEEEEEEAEEEEEEVDAVRLPLPTARLVSNHLSPGSQKRTSLNLTRNRRLRFLLPQR